MVAPFSHPDYAKNADKCPTYDPTDPDSRQVEPCVMCGKPVEIHNAPGWMIVADGNSRFVTDEEAKEFGDAGAFPIGGGCLAKYRNLLEKYL